MNNNSSSFLSLKMWLPEVVFLFTESDIPGHNFFVGENIYILFVWLSTPKHTLLPKIKFSPFHYYENMHKGYTQIFYVGSLLSGSIWGKTRTGFPWDSFEAKAF